VRTVFVLPRITRLTQFEVSQAVTQHRVSMHLIGVLVTLLALTSCFWCTQETREVIRIFKLALTSGVRVQRFVMRSLSDFFSGRKKSWNISAASQTATANAGRYLHTDQYATQTLWPSYPSLEWTNVHWGIGIPQPVKWLTTLHTWVRASWIEFNNCPTRCDLFSLLHFCRQLYIFRVLTPIIRIS